MQKIHPFLWFDKEAEEAANFYTSIFDDSEILGVSRYAESAPGETGSVMTVSLRIQDSEITALNGGPHFKFTEAISLFVRCDSQEEVDELWLKLSDGGEEGQCGWLKDRYGVSWQIVPTEMFDLLQDQDPDKTNRVMKAMLEMQKLDVNVLKKAYDDE